MSLETVELVMEFEDEFEIAIPDAAAEKMLRVADTIDFIVDALRAKLRPPPGDTCPTARRFREIRAALCAAFNVARSKVRPSTAIGDLIPRRNERSQWADFAQHHELPTPPWSFFRHKRFPRSDMTVADLLRHVPDGQYYRADGSVDVERVRQRVCEIVSEQLGVDLTQIHPAVRYIDDLNCG